MFHIAPGAVLFFTYIQGRYPHARFTLLTSKTDEQIDIHTISDVHRHLTSPPIPDAAAPKAPSVTAVATEPAADSPAF
ncbi:hypothetical protein ACFWVP_30800 [Streptomyces sp. NPDC058637]|uniref:hypothetical protein n=1 Tax=Streptomyces sp. NPDC058637 TaxID=3346569 RepID=UPI0036509D1A